MDHHSHPRGAHADARDHGVGDMPLHRHGPASPHPGQALSWSLLRMTGATRLGAALAVIAGLWIMVWLATR